MPKRKRGTNVMVELSNDELELLRQGAAACGMSMEEFVITATRARAHEILSRHEKHSSRNFGGIRNEI